MVRMWLLGMMVAACGVEEVEGQSPPPVLGQPDLHVGNFVLGGRVRAQVDDLVPGSSVQLAASPRMGRGPCVGGVCLNIVSPTVIGSGVADAAGIVRFGVPIPGGYAQDIAAFQALAAVPGGYAKSQARWRVVQPDAPPPVEINPVLAGTFMPQTAHDIFINGDTVWLEVSYGGGCADHDFVLAWDGSYRESFPIQVGLDLWHDPHGDPCDAWITERLRFDLLPLRAQWPYGEPDEMVVHAAGETAMYAW